MKEAAPAEAASLWMTPLLEIPVDCQFGGANGLYPLISNPSFRHASFSLKRPFPAGRVGGLDYGVLNALMFHEEYV
jgi:hypothetical protein